jgi:nitrogen fixation protein FixH
MSFAVRRSDFVLTGRMVLVCLVLFFAIVFGVNAVMIRAATSTFGGVETENAYQAGLAFNREHAAAMAQDGRNWNVTATVTRPRGETAAFVVSLRDGTGAPVTSVVVNARLVHPADARRDHRIVLRERTGGQFEGADEVPAGQWDLLIDVLRDGEELFRSKSRLVLQ